MAANGARKTNGGKTMVVGDGTPGPGRPPGVPNRLTKQTILAARDAFSPVNEKALELMRRHLGFHLAAQEAIVHILAEGSVIDILALQTLNDAMIRGDCPTCRHIFTLSSEYRFGKPKSQELVEAETAEELARLIAEEYGKDPRSVLRDLQEERRKRRAV